jgi:3-methylfumaryl-CoA hydratase
VTSPDRIEGTEVIAAEPAGSLAAMLDIDVPHAAGDSLAPLWALASGVIRGKLAEPL